MSMLRRFVATALIFVGSIFPVLAQTPPPLGQASSAPRDIGIAVFQDGLASEMRTSADKLGSGDRYAATRALDQARHLAKAMTSAVGVDPQARHAFTATLQAIRAGRAALQNGRPAETRQILADGAEALEKARLDRSIPPLPGGSAIGDAEGSPLLNTHGETLGQFRGFETRSSSGVPPIRLEVGGLGFGIGAKTMTLPAAPLLLGKPYMVLATDTKPSALEPK
jgi:hypothetical protein